MHHREEDRLTLKYPNMREELLETLRSLADLEYQLKIWVNKEFPRENFYDDFFNTFRFIEDMSLLTDPESAIGIFLKDENEVQMTKAVAVALERVFDALGTEATDEEYISSREWSDVLKAASQAWQAMKDDIN